MLFKTITNQKLPFFVALGLMAVLTSCGSFQYAGYDNDGIYSDGNVNTETEQPVATTSTNDSNYYKNYFSENSAEVDAINEESEIFTDIDSYEGNYLETAQDTLEQRPAYGGWGQNNSTVTINVIDNGWYGWNDPWLWNGGFGWGWNRWGNNWGWNRWGNNWGWNAGWGYGWNNWGWNAWCPPGYNNWGWNNRYYRNNNRYAYNGGRRGVLYNNNLSRNTRGNSVISRRNYSNGRLSSNSRSAIRNTRSTARIRSNSTSRSIGNTTRTTRSTGTIRNSSPSRTRSNPRISRPTRSTRSSGTVRSTRSTRSSGAVRSSRGSRSSSGSVRSSGSRSSRSSSGSMRSSGSSSRSSGSRSSSSSSRRGRG